MTLIAANEKRWLSPALFNDYVARVAIPSRVPAALSVCIRFSIEQRQHYFKYYYAIYIQRQKTQRELPDRNIPQIQNK